MAGVNYIEEKCASDERGGHYSAFTTRRGEFLTESQNSKYH